MPDDLQTRIAKAEAALKEANRRLGALEEWRRDQQSAEDRLRDEQAHALASITEGAKVAFEKMVRATAAQFTEQLEKAAPLLSKLPELFAMNERQTLLAEEARTERLARRDREKAAEHALKVKEQDRLQSLVDLEVEKHRAGFKTEGWKVWTTIAIAVIGVLGALITAAYSHQTPSPPAPITAPEPH